MDIREEANQLIINLNWWEQLWGMHGSWRIDKSEVVVIREGAPKGGGWDIRSPGTFFPGVIKTGTYWSWSNSGWEYWFWTRSRPFVYTVELKGMRYKRLVLAMDKRLPGEIEVEYPSL